MFRQWTAKRVCGTSIIDWVRTSDNLPDTDRTVIVAYPTKLGMDVWVAYFREDQGWYWPDHQPIGWTNRVLLWADLPQPRFDGKGISGFVNEGPLEDYDL